MPKGAMSRRTMHFTFTIPAVFRRVVAAVMPALLGACLGPRPAAAPPGSPEARTLTPFGVQLSVVAPEEPAGTASGARSLSCPAAAAPGPARVANQAPSSAPPSSAPEPRPQAEEIGLSAYRVPGRDLDCVERLAPEFEQETEWSHELGQRLAQRLGSLAHCTGELPHGQVPAIALRLVYDAKGKLLAPYVLEADHAACSVARCLEQGLADVLAPRSLLDRTAYDLGLSLAPGEPPERTAEPPDPLTSDPGTDSTSCVDPSIAQLSRAHVQQVVSGIYGELKGCYARALSRDRQAAGNVTIEFVIGTEGHVSLAHASDATLGDCEAIRCMVRAFSALTFPEPIGRTVRVIYPIQYSIEQPPTSLR